MSDDTDPDTKDIDALLREDSIRNDAHKGNLGTGYDSHAEQTLSQPTQQTHIQRLLARSAHISSNLRQAFSSIRDTRDMVDIDRESVVQLSAEMDHWAKVLSELDKAFSALLNPASRRPHSTAPAAQSANDQIADPPPLLLAKIAAQDAKIRELESRLKSLDPSVARDLAKSSAGVTAEDSTASRTVNRLIIAMTDHGNLKFPLHKQIITIGRSPQNDIHIRSRFISRFHARIVCDEYEAIVEDLDSSNGISVNARPARRQSLRSGDLIDLGRTQLRYIDLSEGSSGEGQA